MHSPRRKCVNILVTLFLLYLLFQENKSFGAITICIHPLMYKKPCREQLETIKKKMITTLARILNPYPSGGGGGLSMSCFSIQNKYVLSCVKKNFSTHI
jgi:hypothetical protein